MRMLRINSYAKINLGLLLLGKRHDGYHDIATLFQQIDLRDTILFKKTDQSFEIDATGLTIPTDQSNLMYKVFSLIQKRYSIKGGAYVHIEKQIPVGGGLGGGSSNAAMTILALCKLYDLKLESHILQELGTEIGSDVPFFLEGGTALGLGRGEKLEHIEIPMDYWLVLLFPDVSVSTSWAYQHTRIGLTSEEKLAKFRSLLGSFEKSALKENLVNELERVVFQRHPQLLRLKEQLYERDAFYASMSGSGSTVYGLFVSVEEAQEAKSFFSKNGVRARISRPMMRPPELEMISLRERE
jgi:4-diphosphocytidyl-2-C-methyl-D-erythritol kinase